MKIAAIWKSSCPRERDALIGPFRIAGSYYHLNHINVVMTFSKGRKKSLIAPIDFGQHDYMDTIPVNKSEPLVPTPHSSSNAGVRIWNRIKTRILGGLIIVLPIVITVWVIGWIYSGLQRYVIEPLARVVLWAVRNGKPGTELPDWFETYAAPPIAIVLALTILYFLEFIVHVRVRSAIDSVLLKMPVISSVYDSVQKIFLTLDKQRNKQTPQRVVLIGFPHPGMKAPAFVTATCKDIETQRTLLCVYVPTTPVPTSGYFLLVPEDEVTELNWTAEEALQTIVSGGLTVAPEVRYYNRKDLIEKT